MSLVPRPSDLARTLATKALPAASHEAIPGDATLRIASLSNYDWVRGVDRLIDVAAALAARGRRDITFVIAGDMRLGGSLTGELRHSAPQRQPGGLR